MSKLLIRSALATALNKTGALRFVSAFGLPYRILMYHRVIDPGTLDYPIQSGMFVRPETFRMHCKYLAKNANVIPLDELVTLLDQRKPIPQRTIALTFDDGWRDNFQFAVPALKEFRLHATFFLATEFIGTQNLFWTDRAAMFMHAMRTNTLGTLAGLPKSTHGKNLIQIAQESPSELDALERLLEYLFSLSRLERSSVIKQIESFTSIPSTPTFMSWDEVKQMARTGFTFGNHSHRHEILTELSAEEIGTDISLANEALRIHLSQLSPVFCYPRGAWNQETNKMLANLGISHFLLTEPIRDDEAPVSLLGRIGIHEDITRTEDLFALRLS